MDKSEVMLFGALLVKQGAITEAQLQEALTLQKGELQGKRVGEILLQLGYVNAFHITQCLAMQMGVNAVRLTDIAQHAMELIDKKIARRYRVVPIGMKEGAIVLATANPVFFKNAEALHEEINQPLTFVLAAPEEISNALMKCY